MKHEDKFGELVERYNRFIEPLENWATQDIVELIEVLDCELQQREPSSLASAYGVSQRPSEHIGVGELSSAEIAEYQTWCDKYFPIEDEM